MPRIELRALRMRDVSSPTTLVGGGRSRAIDGHRWLRLLCLACIATLNPLTHYVIVRRDLPLGVLGANIVHAAGESSPCNLPQNTIAVVLACADEAELRLVEASLIAIGLDHRAIVETEGAFAGQLMSIGVKPAPKNELKRYFAELKLL